MENIEKNNKRIPKKYNKKQGWISKKTISYKDLTCFDIKLNKLYREYLEEKIQDGVDLNNIVSYDRFIFLITGFSTYVREQLEKGLNVVMPSKLGSFQYIQLKPNKPPILFAQKSNSEKPVKKFANYNTKGYVCKLIWRSNQQINGSIRYYSMYRFRSSYLIKNDIKKSIKDGTYNMWNKYESKQHINVTLPKSILYENKRSNK